MQEDSDLARLAIVETEVDAEYLKNMLAEHGIQLMTMGSEASAFGVSLEGADSIEVYVTQDDLKKAREILEEALDEEEELAPEWTCKCGEEVDEGFAVCWSCGATYEEVHPEDAAAESSDDEE